MSDSAPYIPNSAEQPSRDILAEPVREVAPGLALTVGDPAVGSGSPRPVAPASADRQGETSSQNSAPSTRYSALGSVVVPRSWIRLSRILFGAFVLMVLSFRSIWLRDSVPLWDFPEPFPTIHSYLGGFALPIGMAVLVCVPWLAGRLLENPERPWESGRVGIFLPFLGLSLLLVAGIDPARSARTSSEIPKLLALTWFAYLFVVNERPHLTVPIAFAAAVQGSVAVLQFLTQTDLGLQALGEPPLNTNLDGISILWVQERAWIRSYGLTDHPNWLGAILAVCLLALIPTLATVRGPRRWILAACFAAGFLGMLASFSRAAWLGFSAGLLLHLLLWARAEGRKVPSLDLRLVAASLMVLAFLFLMPSRDLLLSRMIPGDNPVEVRSVTDRLRDAELAVKIIESHPWRGVGAGGFLDAAWPFDPKAVTVHNIPLLVTAEFGLPALALWLLLLAGTFLPARAGVPDLSSRGSENRSREAVIWLPAWTASLVIGLLDPNPWPLLMLCSAILFGVMLGSIARGR